MKEKVLIIVPHQDDEINIAGGLIYSMRNKTNVYVVYTTNGDFIVPAKYRYKEAIKSLKKLGVSKKNILFLGYSDQAYDQNSHMYNSNNVWISNNGIDHTYGALGINDYNFIKHNKHCEFTKKNLIRNIKEVIKDIKPQKIICVDLDFHPDHIMTSLCFDKAIGEILKENKAYNPLVLKSFTYENSYLAPNDLFTNDNYMSFLYDEYNNLLNNPYYNKKNAIHVPILKKCYSLNFLKNPVWKAIKCHKSQIFVKHTESVINTEYVYWKRNTCNIINEANISVSSGNKNYLNDFLLMDTSDVLNGNVKKIVYDGGIWIPDNDDKKKEIIINFSKKTYIHKILLYNGLIDTNFVKEINITLDERKKNIVLSGTYVDTLEINKKVEKLKIQIVDEFVTNGFSEIEILSNSNVEHVSFDMANDKSSKKLNINFALVIIDKIIIKFNILFQKIYRKIFY